MTATHLSNLGLHKIHKIKSYCVRHRNSCMYSLSLENCRAAALNTLSQVSSIQKGDYECGLNCEARDELGGMKVCEKTVH
jgi:hypothetical protein